LPIQPAVQPVFTHALIVLVFHVSRSLDLRSMSRWIGAYRPKLTPKP
jgi:hypothetical protein